MSRRTAEAGEPHRGKGSAITSRSGRPQPRARPLLHQSIVVDPDLPHAEAEIVRVVGLAGLAAGQLGRHAPARERHVVAGEEPDHYTGGSLTRRTRCAPAPTAAPAAAPIALDEVAQATLAVHRSTNYLLTDRGLPPAEGNQE